MVGHPHLMVGHPHLMVGHPHLMVGHPHLIVPIQFTWLNVKCTLFRRGLLIKHIVFEQVEPDIAAVTSISLGQYAMTEERRCDVGGVMSALHTHKHTHTNTHTALLHYCAYLWTLRIGMWHTMAGSHF